MNNFAGGTCTMNEWDNNYYTKLAKQLSLRSRAAFKLLEIQDKYNIINAQSTVLDLGAAPGSWSQLCKRWTKQSCWAIDLQDMEPIDGVQIVKTDIYFDSTQQLLQEWSKNFGIDVILSDMAPNLSGIGTVDQARSEDLNEMVIEICIKYLKSGGNLVMKMFHSGDLSTIVNNLRKEFGKVKLFSVKASRKQSSEVFAVCLDFKSRPTNNKT